LADQKKQVGCEEPHLAAVLALAAGWQHLMTVVSLPVLHLQLYQKENSSGSEMSF